MWRTDIITWIWSTLRKADKIEEYKQILDLQSIMLEMQSRNLTLEEENKQLKQDLEIKWKRELRNNFYYVDWDWPYCTNCRDVKKLLVRAIPPYLNSNDAECPNCKNKYNYTWKEEDYSDFS